MELQTFQLIEGYSLTIVSDNIFFKDKISLTLNIDGSRIQLSKSAAMGLMDSYPEVKRFFAKMMFAGIVRKRVYNDHDVSISIQLTKDKPPKGKQNQSFWELLIHSTMSDPYHVLCEKKFSRACAVKLYTMQTYVYEALEYWECAHRGIVDKAKEYWRECETLPPAGYFECSQALLKLMDSDTFMNEEIMAHQPLGLQLVVNKWVERKYKRHDSDSSNDEDGPSCSSYIDSEEGANDPVGDDVFNQFMSGC